METQEQAIERLLPTEGTLYCVTNWLECQGLKTCVWNIYANLDDAMRWIRLCEENYKNNWLYGYKEISRDVVGDLIKKLVFEHYGTGGIIRQTFVTDIYTN